MRLSDQMQIEIQRLADRHWVWGLYRFISEPGPNDDLLAGGTTSDYDEACRMAKIAWEQHSEGDAV